MPITLFENITEELTDYEKDTLVPMLVDTLRFKTSKNRVKTKTIVDWFKASGVKSMTPVRVRKMIAYIRHLHLTAPCSVIGAGDGYYLSSDPTEILKQVESLRQRGRKIFSAADSLAADAENINRYKKSIV